MWTDVDGLACCCSANVIYYEWKFPEGERHDSAQKRHREALTAELKLWEGYLEKVSNHKPINPNPNSLIELAY